MHVFRKKLNLKNTGCSFLFFMSMATPVAALSVEFNEVFLNKGGAPVELKYFESGSGISPGNYNVDIYLNQAMVVRQSVTFIATGNSPEVRPQISLGTLKAMGINTSRLAQERLIATDSSDESIIDIARLVSGASVEFDVSALALKISVPQAYIQRGAGHSVDRSLWDDGVTALFTDYQLNFNRNISQGYHNDYRFLGLRNGFNLGAWRLRNESSVSGYTGVRDTFSSNRSYIERDVASLNGRFAAGELYTQGEVFDSVRFRGVQLSSELSMLSDEEIGYAPVVRGIAETNATVEVIQNNYVIYSTSVSPGAFEIQDIYPSGSNGDLVVKIIEADGRERQYSQAYSYLPVMIRNGSARYSVAAGQYKNHDQAAPGFGQGTLVYGMSDNFTGYGGLLAATGYKALNLGLGINSPWGGVSFDVTQSSSESLRGQMSRGQSARALYSKTLGTTDTSFTMIGYRYSTENYRTFSQHVEESGDVGGSHYGRQKSRFDLNVNQPLGQSGSLFASMGETSYWNRQGSTRRWQFGYNGNYLDVSYNLALSRTEGQGMEQGADNQLSASLSVPFGGSGRHQRAYSSVTSSSQGDSSVQTGVSGNLDQRNAWNYSVQGSQSRQGGRSANLDLSWDGPAAKVSGNYGQGSASKHMSLGAAGALVAHANGITLGPSVGETFALVEVSGVKGVGVDSSAVTRTDDKGYAIVPYVQPYRYNWISLDSDTLGSDVEIQESSRMVVPTRGAVVKSRFESTSGRRLQFDLHTVDGQKIPFGAQAYDSQGNLLGVVDNLSRLLLFGIGDKGELDVRWGTKHCKVNYELPAANKEMIYEKFEFSCSTPKALMASTEVISSSSQ